MRYEERWARFDEAVAILRSLLRDEPPPETLRHYALPDAQLARPAPARRSPDLDRELGLARRSAGASRGSGDGWLASAYNTTPTASAPRSSRCPSSSTPAARDPDRVPQRARDDVDLDHRGRRRGRSRAARDPGPDAEARSRGPGRLALHRIGGALRRAALALRAGGLRARISLAARRRGAPDRARGADLSMLEQRAAAPIPGPPRRRPRRRTTRRRCGTICRAPSGATSSSRATATSRPWSREDCTNGAATRTASRTTLAPLQQDTPSQLDGQDGQQVLRLARLHDRELPLHLPRRLPGAQHLPLGLARKFSRCPFCRAAMRSCSTASRSAATRAPLAGPRLLRHLHYYFFLTFQSKVAVGVTARYCAAMSENDETVRGVPVAIPPLSEEEGAPDLWTRRLYVRFPRFYQPLAHMVSRLPPRSRIRRALIRTRRMARAYAAATAETMPWSSWAGIAAANTARDLIFAAP